MEVQPGMPSPTSVSAWIGREVVQDLGEVDRLLKQRFAVAVGDMNPLYFDAEAARAAGYAGVIAPPHYVTACVSGWLPGPPEADLRPDGTDRGFPWFPLEGWQLLGGGHEQQFLQPVYPGDRITVQRVLLDVTERPGRQGAVHTFFRLENRYFNQRAELVACTTDTVIASSPRPAAKGDGP